MKGVWTDHREGVPAQPEVDLPEVSVPVTFKPDDGMRFHQGMFTLSLDKGTEVEVTTGVGNSKLMVAIESDGRRNRFVADLHPLVLAFLAALAKAEGGTE